MHIIFSRNFGLLKILTSNLNFHFKVNFSLIEFFNMKKIMPSIMIVYIQKNVNVIKIVMLNGCLMCKKMKILHVLKYQKQAYTSQLILTPLFCVFSSRKLQIPLEKLNIGTTHKC